MKNITSTENLIVQFSNGWLDIWLNQFENRNALTESLINDLFDVFSSVNNEKQVRGITLRGKENLFCAGAPTRNLPLNRDFRDRYACFHPSFDFNF